MIELTVANAGWWLIAISNWLASQLLVFPYIATLTSYLMQNFIMMFIVMQINHCFQEGISKI